MAVVSVWRSLLSEQLVSLTCLWRILVGCSWHFRSWCWVCVELSDLSTIRIHQFMSTRRSSRSYSPLLELTSTFVSWKHATVPIFDQCNGIVGMSPTIHYYGRFHIVQLSIWSFFSSRRWILSSGLCSSTLKMQPLLLRAAARRQTPRHYHQCPYASCQAPLSSRPPGLPALTARWLTLLPGSDGSWWCLGCCCPCPSKLKLTLIAMNTTANETYNTHTSGTGRS